MVVVPPQMLLLVPVSKLSELLPLPPNRAGSSRWTCVSTPPGCGCCSAPGSRPGRETYHDIAALGIDHSLCTVLAEHTRRRQQRDLPILDRDIIVRRVRRGHDETVD